MRNLFESESTAGTAADDAANAVNVGVAEVTEGTEVKAPAEPAEPAGRDEPTDADRMYTTGEVASMCDMSVRTVQYYDTKGLLTPSATSVGGRRLYTDDDVRQLRVINFLKSFGFKLNQIQTMLNDSTSRGAIHDLVESQVQVIRERMDADRRALHNLEQLQTDLTKVGSMSVESLHDMTLIQASRKPLCKVRATMLIIGLIMDVFEIGLLIYGFQSHNWWPFAICIVVIIGVVAALVRYYYQNVCYLCSQCHAVFKPGVREFVFSPHTLTMHKLHCPVCGYYGYCVELSPSVVPEGSIVDDHRK